ncbi:MAG: IgGFc-binding protein [Sorangiineae bacterium]|nr:IgGFc-binding protein [Polyangiaceae bacterium]MEB2324044.1 IgGFc-binding protein [Sorangiineae bacterium]
MPSSGLRRPRQRGLPLALGLSLALGLAAGCSASGDGGSAGGGASSGTGGSGAGGAAGGSGGRSGDGGFDFDASAGGACAAHCSGDSHQVLDCQGAVLATCSGEQGCDPATGKCANACDVTVTSKQSVGCEYFPAFLEMSPSTYWQSNQTCFAVVVANTWNTPAQVTVELGGAPIDIDQYAYVPKGAGASVALEPTSVSSGIAPSGVAILFLAGKQGTEKSNCPVPAAMQEGPMVSGTGKGRAFRLRTNVPVVAYQVNPYGGGNAAVTGSSLLIPTSAWDGNYIGVAAYRNDLNGPNLNVIAKEDGTEVTMVPVAAVTGGGGLPAGGANAPLTFSLNAGEMAQFSQSAELTGSVISSNRPVGLMAGHSQLRVPVGTSYADHAEQMIPPVRAMGNEYVAVMHRQRKTEPAVWLMVGAVDGTALGYVGATPPGAPATLARGQVAEFQTATPFLVSSQDDQHPFLLFELMTGSSFVPGMNGYGDADFVLMVPPQQYMNHYVFFTDPTYPETNLVVVRGKVGGAFADVNLDCAGALGGWQPLGEYEYTRVDLMTGNFQPVGGCGTGRREMSSAGPFGVTVWGWGTPLTTDFTSNVSYGYPAGMNIMPINEVVIPASPK